MIDDKSKKALIEGLEASAFFDALLLFLREKKEYCLDTLIQNPRQSFNDEALALIVSKARLVVLSEIESDLIALRKQEADQA